MADFYTGDRLVRLSCSIRCGHNVWLERPVSDDTLRQLYELMKWGPTSANTCPARIVFIRTPEGKQKLLPALAPGNVQKMMTAPVTAIIAYDLKFYEKLPQLFPHSPKTRDWFARSPELVEVTARRNSSLQGAYLIIAARAVGLDCGPMSGFDNSKVDEAFFGAGQPCEGCEEEFFPEGHVKSNFLCNLGTAIIQSCSRATRVSSFSEALFHSDVTGDILTIDSPSDGMFLIKETAMATIGRILCAIDLERASERAFDRALNLAIISEAKLHLLHATPANVPFSWRATERLRYLTEPSGTC